MSSTKSAIGHLLGAAGAVEAIFSILAIRDNVVPPTLNLDNPSPSCADIDLTPHAAKEHPVRRALSTSFAFDGTNALVVLTELQYRRAVFGRLGFTPEIAPLTLAVIAAASWVSSRRNSEAPAPSPPAGVG